MKFMDRVETTMGQGLVVGAMIGGKILATIPQEVVVRPAEKGQPAVIKRYCPHHIFDWCQVHQVWFVSGTVGLECPHCAMAKAKEAAGGG